MPRRRDRSERSGLLELIEPTPRVAPACPDFGKCGGCSFLDIPYEAELELKRKIVERALGQLVRSSDRLEVVPSPRVRGYRNKMELSFGDTGKDGVLALGIRKRGSFYEVAIPEFCELIPDDFRTIILLALEYFRGTGETFYHRKMHTGRLRYLVLRRGEFTGEILVNLVTAEGSWDLQDWVSGLLGLPLEGKIVGILHTASTSRADAVVPDSVEVLFGRDCFYEKICGLTFGISPFSFFQTNSGGAELLYEAVRECVGGTGGKVYDLYCGTGTIAQVLSPYAKEVVGIELVPEAVAAAQENARLNGIENCRFIAGDVLSQDLVLCPDVLVLDPPRSGVHPKAIEKLVGLGARKVVYVSCKPESLARDLPFFLEGKYRVGDIRVHDMFPRTPHVETIVLLCRGDT